MIPKRHTRRSFLQGAAAARELGGRAQHSLDGAAANGDRSSLLVSVCRRAMACEFEVQLGAHRQDNSMEYVFQGLDLVERLETQMTVYRDDSDVIQINRRAADEPVKVERRLFELLQLAERMHAETNGALDITSTPLSEAWGFSRREGRIPSDTQIEAARERLGMQHVKLDDEQKTIAFQRPGMSINLNSMGKGYSLDRMAELLAEHDVDNYMLHGGKSSILARGDQPGAADRGWWVGVRHPLLPAERLGELNLQDDALSTSGAGTQFFFRRGKRYGHILDPRSGYPAEGLYSATAIAPTAAEAEGLSTAFYVMGMEKTGDFCAERPEVGALLVAPGEREGEVRLVAFGRARERMQPPTNE